MRVRRQIYTYMYMCITMLTSRQRLNKDLYQSFCKCHLHVYMYGPNIFLMFYNGCSFLRFSVGTHVDPLLAVYIIVGVLSPFIFIGLVVLFCCLRKKFCE